MIKKLVGEEKGSYQGTIPLLEWRAFLNDLKSFHHWRQALENSKCPILVQKKKWFTNHAKASFYMNLSLPKRERFLDIGAGSGVIAAELSKFFRSGIAIDYGPEMVEFMNIRFHQDGLDCLSVVRGNGLSLPFCSNMFDLVVVNGVLEWIACDTPDRNCKSVQIEFLKEVLRCLRKKGKIAIAIENQWSLGHFLGQSPHGEPPFVAVMPRFFARILHLIQRKTDYRTYIYSYFGYKRLLNTAGFGDVNVYLAVPNYYNPEYVANITDDLTRFCSDRWDRLKGKRIVIEKILNFLGLLGLFWPAFYITAKKN